ncbi:MAG: hypothetical protein KKH51_12935 [Actinobacteria bacterium]|nr:hypothetical protein [Actinomycetota bacterium]
MNRQLTILFAAFEAILVAAIGVAIPLVPLTLLWGIQYGLAVDWTVFWRAAVDIWLLGHGADITLTLDPTSAALLGLPGAAAPITVTIAALGFALLTALLGIRAGRRVAETGHRLLGLIVSLTTFGIVSFGLAFSALNDFARPSLVQGTLLPAAVFAVGVLIGFRSTQLLRAQASTTPVRDWLGDRTLTTRTVLTTAVRGGAAAAAGVLLLAAVVTAGAIAFSYARIISLYEALHSEVLGGVAVTLGEIAFLPNAVVWTASWLIGPGFSLGTGSTVSPLATQLGPVPGVPLLGALPQGPLALGFLGLLVPVVVGFLVGAILGPRARRDLERRELVLVALGIALVGGIILGMLAWLSGGAAGPGRLVDVGPNPWLVGGWAAFELFVSSLIGLFASLRGIAAGRRG